MSIMTTLKKSKIPVAYGRFRTAQTPPFIVYIGSGQRNMSADDTFFHSTNGYQIEYYYTNKNEANEKAIEQVLLADGYLYDKSEDTYIESEDLFVIYYTV